MRCTYCEKILWDVLPCIRRELAVNLKKRGLKHKEIAQKIGVSTSAISQYLMDKRGCHDMLKKEIALEIQKSTNYLLNGNDIIKEMCRLCRVIRKD
jgi:predicted transcriptional regulator